MRPSRITMQAIKMHRRRQYRRPILGRLTWAWLSAFGVIAALAGVFLYATLTDDGAGRIALPIEQIEQFARAAVAPQADETPEKKGVSGLRLSPPHLREGEGAVGGQEFGDDLGEDADDALTYMDEALPEFVDDPVTDIIITIDGKQQGDRPNAVGATITRPFRTPIPDPEPELLRATPLGKVPRIAPDGRKALNVYARPFKGDYSKPRIAIVVGGLGLNAGLTERAIDELPPEISLSFAPYAKDLDFWTKKAREAGHEILIELPMEGYGDNQQALGNAALLSTRTEQENLQRLDWLLSRFGGYFAATNYMGSKFSTNEAALTPVLRKLREAGVGYIDDTGAAGRAGAASGAALTMIDKIISAAPDDSGRRTVKRELAKLEQIAKREGAAIGKTYAYAATLDEIAAWTAKLDDKSFSVAPVSAILLARTASR
jgi:polysaccharide deacetylase 2 family uncharacterized protein YibQ